MQQEKLSNLGRPRKVLLLFDDVEVDSETASALGFFATRHRHFDVSMCYCSVRYSNVHKSYRASSDALLLFGTPMASDRKLMLTEYSQSPRFAGFCMSNLKQYQALVFMNGFKQELYRFRIQDDLHNFEGFEPDCVEETTDDNLGGSPLDIAPQNSNAAHENETGREEQLQSVSTERNLDTDAPTNNDSDYELNPV
jgi:hypothetical protein